MAEPEGKTASGGRMQIGELADRAGVSQRTIHYYERLGLLPCPEREGAGYRYFDETAVKVLKKIAALKGLGLSLEEIGSVIGLFFKETKGLEGKRKVLALLEQHRARTDEKMSELAALRTDLDANIAKLKAAIETAERG